MMEACRRLPCRSIAHVPLITVVTVKLAIAPSNTKSSVDLRPRPFDFAVVRTRMRNGCSRQRPTFIGRPAAIVEQPKLGRFRTVNFPFAQSKSCPSARVTIARLSHLRFSTQ